MNQITPLFLGFLLSLPWLARAEDWPRWRGPELNGISRETNWATAWPQEGPKPLWRASVGIGFASLAVSQGRVYTTGNTGNQDTLFCFEAPTGRVLWKHSYPCGLRPQYYEGGTSSTPTIEGDHVYALSKEGHLFRLEASSGKVLWQKHLVQDVGATMPRWGFAGSPLVSGDLLILNAGPAGVALRKDTGEVAWSSGAGPAGYATAVPLILDREECALIFSAKALACVRIKDGHEFWRQRWVSGWDLNVADPIVDGDKVLISSFDQGATLFQVSTGGATELWHNKSLSSHFNSGVLFRGRVYGIDGNTDKPPADLRCLDFETGVVRWRQAGLGFGSLVLAAGKLIVLSDKGELVVAHASPEGFQPLARAQVLGGKCWSTPVLSDGRLFCRNAQGTLVCLDVRSSPGG